MPDASRLAAAQTICAANTTKSSRHGFISLPEIKNHLKAAGLPPLLELREGFNILINSATQELFGVVNYRLLSDLSAIQQSEVFHVMRLVDLVSRTTNNIISVNGASHAHGKKAAPHGLMAEYGWRNSYDKGGGIIRYKPRRGEEAAMEQLEREMPLAAKYFNTRFNTIYPSAYQATNQYAEAHQIPRFDVLKPGPTTGANNFTVTRSGFSNTPHRDKDRSPFNIGMFFAGPVENGTFGGQLPRVSKHIHGGEFWWPELGVVVGHAPANGWAEIIWRGATDLHGTLACWLEPGKTYQEVDRWGSACQITGKFQTSWDKVRTGWPKQ